MLLLYYGLLFLINLTYKNVPAQLIHINVYLA